MSNENNRENMDDHPPEKAFRKTESPQPPSAPVKRQAASRDNDKDKDKSLVPQKPQPNPGIVIKNVESASLNSLLVYDSDSSSSSSEMEKLNLNWRPDAGSEDSSTTSSSSSSEEDSESSSEDEEVLPPQNRGAVRKSNASTKTDGDIPLEQLPPVPDLSQLSLSVADENFVHMGNVLGIVDKLVTVAAIPNQPAYDLDTLLFLDDGKRPLGFVFDVLGQVTSPIYAVRFNSVEDIKTLQVQVGTKVYSAPTSKHTQYVFLQHLLKLKGTDASWLGDSEVPSEFADYSDDETECCERFGNKRPSPHVKRTHSSDNHKKFETTMNRRNILNTKFNKYMDSYKQARSNKAKVRRGAPQINTSVPLFDPTVPPPTVQFYQGLPPAYNPHNNNAPLFVNSFGQPNPGYFTNPGPSHQ